MTHIPVFFTPAMVAQVASFSPSAGKPIEVVRSWRDLGISISVHEPAPATVDQLCMAHDSNYVRGVLACQIDNGFRDRSQAVAKSLLYTSGAMLAAAQAAIDNAQVAVAPCSGFHHAGWENGGGFCTFNGLMVTACALKKTGAIQRVGILDFDQHWGNGTHDIITKLGASSWVTHFSASTDFGEPSSAEAFIEAIPKLLMRYARCDLVLYQAGADPHIDDPLGGWLTTAQLQRRDAAVFRALKEMRVPVAWNLAGGYQQPLRKVLDIHDNTLIACASVFGMPNETAKTSHRSGGVVSRPLHSGDV
jgi:acetoin utilization deacetylase AcuC-like enzyme